MNEIIPRGMIFGLFGGKTGVDFDIFGQTSTVHFINRTMTAYKCISLFIFKRKRESVTKKYHTVRFSASDTKTRPENGYGF